MERLIRLGHIDLDTGLAVAANSGNLRLQLADLADDYSPQISTDVELERFADTSLKRIEARRDRRSDFFHSTHLLDLDFHALDCMEAFCDLLDYGKLLFPGDWDTEIPAAGNMETCESLIRLDRKACPAIRASVFR